MTNVNKILSINDKNLLTLFFSGVSIQVTEKETDGGIINEKGQTYCFYKDLC